jgi:D-alanine-D-alanine ligase
VYTYDAKWAKKTWEYADARVDAPAKIPAGLQEKIETLTLNAYRAFKCRDIARIDVRVDEKGDPFIVDVNMNPSINFYDEQDATLASVYALGWTYDQFIERLLAVTYDRVYGGQLKDKRLRK